MYLLKFAVASRPKRSRSDEEFVDGLPAAG